MRLLTGESTLPMHVTWNGDTAVATLGTEHIVARLGPNGLVSEIVLPPGHAAYVIAISPIYYQRFPGAVLPLPSLVPSARDYSVPRDAPYEAVEVQAPAKTSLGAAFTLGCTLTRPKAGGPRFPAMVTINGSGPGERDADAAPLLTGYHLYRQVADWLGRAGISVLRCDKRGSGASLAPFDPADTLVKYLDDAAAAVSFLRARSDVDAARIGVIGHSRGTARRNAHAG